MLLFIIRLGKPEPILINIYYIISSRVTIEDLLIYYVLVYLESSSDRTTIKLWTHEQNAVLK